MAVSRESHTPSGQDHAIIGSEPLVLSRIVEPGINLAILEREVHPALRAFCEQTLTPSGLFAHELVIQPEEELAATLPESITSLPGAEAFLDDLSHINELWHDLFSPDRSGLRLRVLNQAMCPRFNVDRVIARLIVSYGGVGTEWLPETATNRSLLGRPLSDPKQDPLANTEQIQAIPPYAIALLKGEAWPGNEGRGIAHRSPPIEPPQRRALLTMDILA
ncbi:hypothetical protein J2T60_001179 [Natronospira proteinivora]|uniref:DUF1826 domain-containing protein n=1 Tax=Natronospira proteinivora TaxID=1807133 RepID=A0ABT1G7D4_9GAMM|nr:DUF1826 domain-containing protein [Natronospira proteinivora]MCP1727214.1 hypothetical protein [Natronospira proteinivora]